MNNVKILIGGQTFNNFEDMRIYSDLYSLADTFSFAGVLPRNVSPSRAYNNIKCGQRCVISINSKTVMNGYVTNTRLSRDANGGTRLDFGGVDTCGWVTRLSSAETKQGDFTPVQIIAELKRQIPAMAQVSFSGIEKLPKLDEFVLNTGESVSETLNQIADRTNTIFYANSAGTIVFGKKSRGGNYHSVTIGKDRVKKASVVRDIQDVFDEVALFCEGGEEGFTSARLAVPFVAKTNAVKYDRVQARMDEITGYAQKRANDIISGYLKMRIEYAGFTDAAGKIWEINKAVSVSDITDGKIYSGNLVVESAEFMQSRNEGQTANLTLSLPAAF